MLFLILVNILLTCVSQFLVTSYIYVFLFTDVMIFWPHTSVNMAIKGFLTIKIYLLMFRHLSVYDNENN